MVTYDWIIGICSSGAGGVRFLRFRGTTEEAKQKLCSLVQEDRSNDIENWDYGTEEPEDVQVQDGGLGYDLYAYGCYSDYHIDYSAKEWAHVDFE